MRNAYAVRKFHPISEKEIKMQYDEFRRNCLNIDVLEISMYEFVDRDGPLDDNFNEPIHKSLLYLQDAHYKNKAFSCVLSVM